MPIASLYKPKNHLQIAFFVKTENYLILNHMNKEKQKILKYEHLAAADVWYSYRPKRVFDYQNFLSVDYLINRVIFSALIEAINMLITNMTLRAAHSK